MDKQRLKRLELRKMPESKLKIAVLAGDYEQFTNWFLSQGLSRHDVIYVCSPQSCLGVTVSKIEIIGTFWERDDAFNRYCAAARALKSSGLINDRAGVGPRFDSAGKSINKRGIK